MSSKRSSSVNAPDSSIRWYCSTEKRAIRNGGTALESALTIRSEYSSTGAGTPRDRRASRPNLCDGSRDGEPVLVAKRNPWPPCASASLRDARQESRQGERLGGCPSARRTSPELQPAQILARQCRRRGRRAAPPPGPRSAVVVVIVLFGIEVAGPAPRS